MTEKTAPENVLATADALRWEAGTNLHDLLMESMNREGALMHRTHGPGVEAWTQEGLARERAVLAQAAEMEASAIAEITRASGLLDD